MISSPAPRRFASLHRNLALYALALGLCAAVIGQPAHAETSARPVATITLQGQGTISLAPDMAVVTARVVTPAKTAPEALSQNTAAITKVIAEIKAAGILAKDIQTSGFSIYPRYDNSNTRNGEPAVITAYEVGNGVTIQIRDLTKLGSILDAVVRSGANSIGGINFQISDAADKQDVARKAAVADARRKADLYASAAGVTLGRLLSISEAGTSAPRPYAMRAQKMTESNAAVPIEAGEETLSASVTMIWELSQ